MPRARGALPSGAQTTEAVPGGPLAASPNGSQRVGIPPAQDQGVLALGYASGRGYVPGDEVELTRQAAAIDRFCARRGWRLVRLVRDVRTLRRERNGQPSLTFALDQLRRGNANTLVVADLTRLPSSVADLGDVLVAVELAGARLVSLKPAIDSGTASGRAIMRALTSVSQWERARRAEMTSAARAKAARPLAIEPKLKRRIKRMRGAGMTLQAIADTLNDDGVPTARGGASWRPSSVQAALGYRRPGQPGRTSG